MSQYFPKPYEPFGGDVNFKINLSNYATNTDVLHLDVSSFALTSNLAILKSEIDKLDIDKLVPAPVDLSKLSDVVKNNVVKKTVYDKSVKKVNNIDTTGIGLKITYDTDKSDLEKKINDVDKKIPDTSDLAKKADLNATITEIENKIPSINNLATNLALTAVENKIPDNSSLVKKTDYDAKVIKTENKYSAATDYNKFTKNMVSNSIRGKHLITETYFDAKLNNLN